MSREIRISVDDDEVFERMKRRKQALDLSWEEVLHRGLRRAPSADQPGRGPSDPPWGGPEPEPWESGPYGPRGQQGPRDPWDEFADDLEAKIRGKVFDSLRTGFGAAGIDVPDASEYGLDDEVETLTNAEDATLVFDFLEDGPGTQVPLRVNLTTSREGLDVEVVAVRQGKNVSDMNRFGRETRKRVNSRLAAGEPATLRFAEGVEEYRVLPVLSWSRDERGDPVVVDVEIAEVLVDGDE